MNVRFLVVEDDPAFAENLSELLELAGHSSELAHNAAEARELASKHSFDAALVDLGLPDARGNDLVAEIKARSPYLMAIVLTEQPTLRSARDAIRSGATAYMLKDGDPRELEAVIRRTAEQAELGRALRESEARYATLVERAPLGIALVKDGRYTFANERYARIFGLPDARGLVGRAVEEVYHPDERGIARERWGLDREPWQETYAITGARRNDGRPIDVMVTRSRMEVRGEVAVQLIVRDITNETRLSRELEDARLQIEEKRRLAALGEMVAGIAHEIRNPLQVIAWGLNELKACETATPAEREAVEKIQRGTREVEAIIAEVLDYARPMKAEKVSFPIAELLEGAREDALGFAEGAGVGIAVDTSRAPAEAVLDALKIKRALVNLARNAIEASPRGSTVVLRASGGSGARDPLVLEVEDEGSGLPLDLGDRIYLPFVTTKVKGTGLGLAIVRRIVEAHGGTMRLETRAVKGTLARIELPVAADG